MSKMQRYGCAAIFSLLLLCLLFLIFVFSTRDVLDDEYATQTQNRLEVTWDAEFHATLTAEAR